MTAYRHIPVSAAPIALPLGTRTEAPGQVRVELPHNARTRGMVCSILERLASEGALASSAAAGFTTPTVVDDRGDALVLDYTLAADAMAFSAALPRFLKAPAIYLPELIGLARYLASAGDALVRVDVPALIGPATLTWSPSTEGAWRLLVVPLVDVALPEWAAASPDAWAFTPAAALLGKPAPHATAYAIGAALVTGLTGGLWPAALAPNARFVRALRGWVGRPHQLAGCARAALPASFTQEAAALSALASALLEAVPPTDWRDRLAQVSAQLAAHRVAVRWEHEGQIDVARGIVERLAQAAPAAHVPWETVARLRGSSDDIDGALQAAIDAVDRRGDDHAVRELAAVARRIAHALPPARHRPMLERAVDAADRLGARLGPLGRLHFAHLEARYLERFERAATRLAAPVDEPWNNVLRDTLLARIHAARAAWSHTARVCKQARAATLAMPDAGGPLGGYVAAYLDYLDGVAHCGAVRVYRDPGYLADAFERLTRSLGAAHAMCGPGDPLVDGAVDWLHTVDELAADHGLPDRAAIHSGVVGFLGALGLTRRLSEPHRREPSIAWYDAGRLLALSGAP